MSFHGIKTVPHYHISDHEAGRILLKMRAALRIYNMSFQKFFKSMDFNNDGFVVIDELVKKMKEIAANRVTKEEIDKFFNYMD